MKIVIDKESIIKTFGIVLYALSGGESGEDYINTKEAVDELLEKIGYEPYEDRPQGEWIPIEPDCRGYTEEFECSNCNNRVKYSYCMKESEYPICPYCGADMIKEMKNE